MLTPATRASDASPHRPACPQDRDPHVPALRFWREPALHFLVLGGLLFLLHGMVRPASGGRRIVVSAAYVAGLATEHQRRTGSPPTQGELRALIDRFVDEEVLYREAKALGLDRGDPIIRRRLIQKTEFLSQDLLPQNGPSDAELSSYLASHEARFRLPPRIGLSHVFLSSDRRGAALTGDAARVLVALRATPAAQAPARSDERAFALGDPFLLGNELPPRSEAELAGMFGGEFAAQVMSLQPRGRPDDSGAWQGPVASRYGLHLVRINERIESAPPSLSQVRAQVTKALLTERTQQANQAYLEKLRRSYDVQIERTPLTTGTDVSSIRASR